MKINVAVFFGGSSVEHEVSVISAVQAMHSMKQDKYNLVPVYITKSGEFYHSDSMTDINVFKDIDKLLAESKKVSIVKEKGEFFVTDGKSGLFSKKLSCKIEIAFPIVHGTNCEDGSIAGYFELIGLPYVSCDVVSAAVGMDKVLFKSVLQADGIPTLPCIYFYGKQWVSDKTRIISEINEKIGYPLIVKPANLGSSVGIVKVKSESELEDAVSLSMSFAGKILIERAITELREINCSVLGDCDECRPSVCEEPIMSDEILSYKDKYVSEGKSKGMTSLKRKIPADIPKEKEEEIKRYACETFRTLGCNGVVRIDFLMDAADDNKVYVNEINTIPGSLSFYLWEPAGLPYTDMLDELIDLGFKRARMKNNLMFTYDTNILASGGAFGSKGKK
ncbi:MAG: D-alanine--D-alanine ligase [Clostridiales bacterium 43-6]|nr:MAG: D-alanine--D-alanine ligase [Clostridiales bacterium 43-6]